MIAFLIAKCSFRLAVLRFATLALLLGFGSLIQAHPLGNFTVSHYTRLEIAAERISLRYIVDMAELSTFQEFEAIDTNGNRSPDKEELEKYGQRIAPQYAQGIELTIDDQQIPLRVAGQRVLWQAGEEGAPNLRVECDFVGDLSHLQTGAIHHLQFEDTNRRERSGWREIVVLPGTSIAVFDSTAFGDGITDELKAYPKDLLTAMLHEQSAELSFTTGAVPVGGVALQTRNGQKVAPQSRWWRMNVITAPTLFVIVGVLGLLLVALLGGFRRFFLVVTKSLAKHS